MSDGPLNRDAKDAGSAFEAALSRLESAIDHTEADRASLQAEVGRLRAELAESERRRGALEAETAALRRKQTALAQRLDDTIAQVAKHVEGAD